MIDKKNFEELKKIPGDSVVIYIMNHRSNVDYVLVAYMLAERISLSYAVGEWARVWPLEYIFKSFGSYFIRRKYREPLYHTVLEKYIQLISKNGITQGIFIEGGLSRDGSLREPKIGLLDYIIRTIQDPGFTKDLVFVPVGINYDRVLEDLSLVGEAHGAPPEKRGLGKVLSGLSVIVTVPRVIVRNGFYYIFKGVRKYGYTSVAVGEHVSLRDYVARLDRDIFSLDADEYKQEVKRFSQHVLEGVGRVVPVTPVTFVAYALLADGRAVIPQADLVELMTEMKKALVLTSARIVRGKEFVDLDDGKAAAGLRGRRPHRRAVVVRARGHRHGGDAEDHRPGDGGAEPEEDRPEEKGHDRHQPEAPRGADLLRELDRPAVRAAPIGYRAITRDRDRGMEHEKNGRTPHGVRPL